MTFSLRDFSLDGRRALVTGGATGLGAAIAAAMAAAGADVAVTSRNRPAEATLDAIRAKGRAAADFKAELGDLDAASATAFAARVEAEFGAIDILVNNAGIVRRGAALKHGEEAYREVMAANVDAVFLLSQAFGRGMAERGFGRIVNIASLLSFQGGVLVPSYAVSKHAVVGMTKAFANELAPKGVTVNGVAPGYIATEFNRALREDPKRGPELMARIPAGDWGEPDDIAAAAVFLASPAAKYVTGEVLTVDGGWMAR